MAKPKAPTWLREAFRDGVDERVGQGPVDFGAARIVPPAPPYPAANPYCWLAQHDPARRPCSGPIERFHFIPRQRVENALAALLPTFPPAWEGPSFTLDEAREIVLLAAWDPRNGGLGCEHHHRRFDGHACSPRAPRIVVPQHHLPYHVLAFAVAYGFEEMPWFRDRFPMPSVPDAG